MIVASRTTRQDIEVPIGVLAASREVWLVEVDGKLVLTCGVAQQSMLGEAEVWLHLYDGWKRREVLRALRPLLAWVKGQYPKLYARAEECDARLLEFVGMRFVRWDEWEDGRRWKRYEL